MSAGEAQLLAFARLLLRDPGLVILDEAASRLDPITERRLERAIDRLLAGRTAIVIAHRLHTVSRADDILILEEGRVVEFGPRRRWPKTRHRVSTTCCKPDSRRRWHDRLSAPDSTPAGSTMGVWPSTGG